jgi:hypothetical protein
LIAFEFTNAEEPAPPRSNGRTQLSERRSAGRALRQPDELYQASTDQAADILSRRLLQSVSSFQGVPSPTPRSWGAVEYQIGRWSKWLAQVPSPKALAPVNRAVAAVPMDLPSQRDCVCSLLRQGAQLDDPGMIAALEGTFQAILSKSWHDQSETSLVASVAEVVVCAIPERLLGRPRREYLGVWQKFSSLRDVVRALGSMQDESLWPLLLEAAAASKGHDADVEIANAVTELLSPALFPQFLVLIRDESFFNWCGGE